VFLVGHHYHGDLGGMDGENTMVIGVDEQELV
jgi:hypothetical protein